MNRREFLAVAGSAGVAPMVVGGTATGERLLAQGAGALAADRRYWIAVLTRLADPVLKNLAAGTLKAQMPVEQATGREPARRSAISRLSGG